MILAIAIKLQFHCNIEFICNKLNTIPAMT